MARSNSLPDEDELIEAVEAARREVKYIVTDFSVELVVGKFAEKAKHEGDIYIPEYQRNLAWTEEQQSYFIESLLLRFPVPPVFFYDVDGKLEIVDGSQRLRSLVNFHSDNLELTGLEKIDALNGLKFSQLPKTIKRRFNNTPVRSFVLEQSTDETTRVDLFRRLNTSGKRLTDAEIRKGAFKGRFLDLVIESAKTNQFKQITPRIGGNVDEESERQELTTRFFVYLRNYCDFTHDVRRFLDEKTQQYNIKARPIDLQKMDNIFVKTCYFLLQYHPTAFYRTPRANRLPRVRFEAVAVGTALAIETGKPLRPASLRAALDAPAFAELVSSAGTNSAPKLRNRIEYVRDALTK